MKRSFVLLAVSSSRASIPHHHFGAPLEHRLNQKVHLISRIGLICVGQNIDIGLDLMKSPTERVALALANLVNHAAPDAHPVHGAPRNLSGLVGRVIVDNPYLRIGQLGVKCQQGASHRLGLVPSWQYYRNSTGLIQLFHLSQQR
jgi:hypothetical protein